MDRKRYDDAIQSLTVCIALEPENPVCYGRRGLAFLERGKHTVPPMRALTARAARIDFDTALARNPQPAERGTARLLYVQLEALRGRDCVPGRTRSRLPAAKGF